ncbi:MAG: hypothetical protein OXG88_07805 [Gammaproteobacteria bacterium]|nr:hypothetical protein [Gammaproteobacteria bacterium]
MIYKRWYIRLTLTAQLDHSSEHNVVLYYAKLTPGKSKWCFSQTDAHRFSIEDFALLMQEQLRQETIDLLIVKNKYFHAYVEIIEDLENRQSLILDSVEERLIKNKIMEAVKLGGPDKKWTIQKIANTICVENDPFQKDVLVFYALQELYEDGKLSYCEEMINPEGYYIKSDHSRNMFEESYWYITVTQSEEIRKKTTSTESPEDTIEIKELTDILNDPSPVYLEDGTYYAERAEVHRSPSWRVCVYREPTIHKKPHFHLICKGGPEYSLDFCGNILAGSMVINRPIRIKVMKWLNRQGGRQQVIDKWNELNDIQF